ncbi:MAG: hypothetical protein LLF96_01870 [Eubacteriales bacterium]|nr:hypothetical protein [Eubacteriales bacterium]
MRKPRRWPVFVGVLLCAFGLLLLLSALIEAPAQDTSPAADPHAVTGAMLLPAAPPAPETASQSRWVGGAFLPGAFLLCLLMALPLLVKSSDANGRILRKKRYVCSFYPVFKQELACG